LRDRKDPLVVLLLPFFFAQVGEKTKVVMVNCKLATTILKLTLTAMPVQN